MSKLGSLYIKLGEPEGEMPGCCETAEWAADEIERLTAERDALFDAMQHPSYEEENRLRAELDALISDVERCYKMLMSEPDTKGALFKTENILREALAAAKEIR